MRIQYNIVLLTAAALLLFSCVKEPYEQPTGGPGDGTATRITLSIKSDSRPSAGYRGTDPAALARTLSSLSALPGTRALTPQQEGLISNVHILVFDAAGAVAANEHFDGLNITGTSNIPFESLPGENMQIVVVANGDVNDHTGTSLDQKLKAVTTLDGLKALLVEIDGDGLSRTDRLMMVGSTTTTITKPQNTAIPVELHFLDTKVTVTVKDEIPAVEAITITGWDVVNIPKKSYLKERTAPDQEDAVNGSTPGDYTSTNGKFKFETVDPVAKTWAHTLYLFENRRGGRVERSNPSGDTYPDMGVGDNDQRGKAYYAPDGATYMLIYGTYTKDGRMNNVVYKIFLGENEINDYNLFRGKHYNYNVTIKGLKNINVDTNVEWGAASFSVDKSDNLLLDAHPDFRVFRIGGTAVDAATPAYATVEVLDADGTTPCTWLALSPLNLYRHGVKQAAGDHQQFDLGHGVGSYVRSKYTAAPTAESTFAEATFGMTRRLTKIPFNQPAIYTYENVMVYADAYEGTTDRTAKVRITYYRGADGAEKAGELTYDITQSGAIRVSDDLYMERYEESAMLMHPGLASGLQKTATMQWGYNTAMLCAADDRFSNGNYLTANAVYNNVNTRNGMTPPTWTANAYADYREVYPRTGEKVTTPSTLTTTGVPYYYPDLTAGVQPSAYFHPIFNSSAARYCHEKNRDTDGDGVISASETMWYLPSFADMWYISKNMPAGTTLSGTYWTASEETNANSWAYTFPATPASSAKTTAARVRCVRGNGAVLPDATIESTETDKTKITLAATAGAAGAFNIHDVTGLPWTVSVSDDATSWLKIASSTLGTDAAAYQSGTYNKTLYVFAADALGELERIAGTIELCRNAEGYRRTAVLDVVREKTEIYPQSTIVEYGGVSEAFTVDVPQNHEWSMRTSPPLRVSISEYEDGRDAKGNLAGSGPKKLYIKDKGLNITQKDRTHTKDGNIKYTNITTGRTETLRILLLPTPCEWEGTPQQHQYLSSCPYAPLQPDCTTFQGNVGANDSTTLMLISNKNVYIWYGWPGWEQRGMEIGRTHINVTQPIDTVHWSSNKKGYFLQCEYDSETRHQDLYVRLELNVHVQQADKTYKVSTRSFTQGKIQY